MSTWKPKLHTPSPFASAVTISGLNALSSQRLSITEATFFRSIAASLFPSERTRASIEVVTHTLEDLLSALLSVVLFSPILSPGSRIRSFVVRQLFRFSLPSSGLAISSKRSLIHCLRANNYLCHRSAVGLDLSVDYLFRFLFCLRHFASRSGRS